MCSAYPDTELDVLFRLGSPTFTATSPAASPAISPVTVPVAVACGGEA